MLRKEGQGETGLTTDVKIGEMMDPEVCLLVGITMALINLLKAMDMSGGFPPSR